MLACDTEQRRSTSGYTQNIHYVFILCGGAIHWGSILQRTMAVSTLEGECQAAALAPREAFWPRTLLGDLGHVLREPLLIWFDTQGALALLSSPLISSRFEHIPTPFTRERVQLGQVKFEY
jgi:hypothetical protein